MSREMTKWHRFDNLVPLEIYTATPRRVLKLGDHIGKTISLDADRWLIVCYNQDGDPSQYMTVPNPHKTRELP